MFLANDDVTPYSTGKRTEREGPLAKIVGLVNEFNGDVSTVIELLRRAPRFANVSEALLRDAARLPLSRRPPLLLR